MLELKHRHCMSLCEIQASGIATLFSYNKHLIECFGKKKLSNTWFNRINLSTNQPDVTNWAFHQCIESGRRFKVQTKWIDLTENMMGETELYQSWEIFIVRLNNQIHIPTNRGYCTHVYIHICILNNLCIECALKQYKQFRPLVGLR